MRFISGKARQRQRVRLDRPAAASTRSRSAFQERASRRLKPICVPPEPFHGRHMGIFRFRAARYLFGCLAACSKEGCSTKLWEPTLCQSVIVVCFYCYRSHFPSLPTHTSPRKSGKVWRSLTLYLLPYCFTSNGARYTKYKSTCFNRILHGARL